MSKQAFKTQTEHTYRPYPETQIIRENYDLKVSTPWLTLELELEPENLNWSDSKILEELSDYPFAYAVNSSSPSCRKALTPDSPALSSHLKDFKHYLGDTEFEFDHLLSDSIIDHERIDPITLYTYLRRKRYQNAIDFCQSFSLFDMLDKQSTLEFIHKVRMVLRQNHYVTQKCFESLQPALEISKVTYEVMKKFIKEEQGHDYILEEALNSIPNTNIKDIEVFQATKDLMKLLKTVAGHQELFPAFCCLLESFEGSSFDETDPLADYLSKNKLTKKAAQQLQKHHEINLHGHHFSIGHSLLSKFDYISFDQAYQCVYVFNIAKTLNQKIVKGIIHA